MKLTVIVPVFNEAKTIGTILEKLLAQEDVFEVVVVDDHSTDTSAAIVKSLGQKRVKLVSHSKNEGKGAAIITGLAHTRGDYVLIQDADLEYDPKDIPTMLEPVKQNRATVVFGSRFLGPHTNMFFWHMIGNKLLNLVINVLFDSIVSDMETGYKLIPTDLLRSLRLRSRDFRMEPEITCKLLKRRVKIMEVPISYVARTYAEGKKIGWQDWFKAIDTILYLRLSREAYAK